MTRHDDCTGSADPRLPAVPGWPGHGRAAFEAEVLPAHRPMLLRGLVADWPLVRQAMASPEALCRALLARASDRPVDAVLVPPAQRGRLFYDESGSGFNFLRQPLPLARVIEQLVRYSHFDTPPAVAVQSALLSVCAPGFGADHPMPLLDAAVAPRLWLGNAITTPAHFDESHNLACVLAGRRRFTLFPPAQIAHLYPGPPMHAPTGTPISLADLRTPDFARFPRLREAFAQASVALLEPGDVLYIPPLWWHHVESLTPLNGLVNYWWRREGEAPALDSLLAALRVLGSQPPAQRQAWAAVFGHYLFDSAGDARAAWPPGMRAAADAALAAAAPTSPAPPPDAG